MKLLTSTLTLTLLINTSSAAALSVLTSRALFDTPKCPENGTLSGTYLTPTLMVPVSSRSPNTAFGPTSFPRITPSDFCTIFNLLIPPTATGKTCTLEFLFPKLDQSALPYAYSGGGHFTFTGYAFGTGATKETTFNMQPPPGPSPPQPPAVLRPGNAYTINVGGCPVEEGSAGLEVSGKLCSTDTTFTFLQSEKRCPIGFFVAIS